MKFAPLVLALFTMLTSCINAGSGEKDNFKAVETFPENQGSLPNPAQQGSAFSISTDVFYQGAYKPVSARERVLSLWLTPTFEAKMKTEYMDSSRPELDEGKWKTLENGNLMLELNRVDGKDSLTLEFKTDGEKLVYMGSENGLNGLTLWVKAMPESK